MKKIIEVMDAWDVGYSQATQAVIEDGPEVKGESFFSLDIVEARPDGHVIATICSDGVVLNVFGFGQKPRTVHAVGASVYDVPRLAGEFAPARRVSKNPPRCEPYYLTARSEAKARLLEAALGFCKKECGFHELKAAAKEYTIE